MAPASWRWGAVLAFALFAPIGLPAGGAERRLPAVKRRSASEPLVPSRAVALHVAPATGAPQLQRVAAGQPLHVLRRWATSLEERWLLVQLADHPLVEGPTRGWVRLPL